MVDGGAGGGAARDDLASLIAWLRTGEAAGRRLDFPVGTALPDGRLDLCKQDVGPDGAALVMAALPAPLPRVPAPVRHLLLGTDALGDAGAATVAAGAGTSGVETLYLGCNGITAGGACRMADQLRASPQAVSAVWLKRNPLGPAGGAAGADLVEAAALLRTLDLVQTGLTVDGLARVVDALIAAAGAGRRFERIYVGGNPLGALGAEALARLVSVGAVGELYVSAAGVGDAGADALSDALAAAEPGRLARLSVASNGIGPAAAVRLIAAAARSGVEVLDLRRMRAAAVLAAPDNRIDADAAAAIGAALAQTPHQLSHLVLANTGMSSGDAVSLLRNLNGAPVRIVLGKGIATTVRRQFTALAADVAPPAVPADVAAVKSVYRTAPLP
jgi:hypothetical protein